MRLDYLPRTITYVEKGPQNAQIAFEKLERKLDAAHADTLALPDGLVLTRTKDVFHDQTITVSKSAGNGKQIPIFQFTANYSWLKWTGLAKDQFRFINSFGRESSIGEYMSDDLSIPNHLDQNEVYTYAAIFDLSAHEYCMDDIRVGYYGRY